MDERRKNWKNVGYQGFSRFVASDADFFILRRFDQLAAWTLLRRQDEIVELESQLGTLEEHLRNPDVNIHNGSFREETQQTRKDLLDEIDLKLQTYYDIVEKYTNLRSRPKVDNIRASSIATWFGNHQHAIHEPETDYIHHQKDLFLVRPPDTDPVRQLLERSKRFRLASFWTKATIDDGAIHYSSEQRIDLFVSLIVTFLGIFLLIAPLWILAFVEDQPVRLAVITVFVVILLPLITFTSNAKPFEALAATAAYAAVLVVFLQINPLVLDGA